MQVTFRYIRRVSANKWQARVWLNPTEGHLNLGLYDSAKDAWDAVRAYLNRGVMPDGLLPRWVRRVLGPNQDESEEAGWFTAWGKVRGHQLRVGTFDTAEAAHAAMRELIAATFPCGLPQRPSRARAFALAVQRERDRLLARRAAGREAERGPERLARLQADVDAVRTVLTAEPSLDDPVVIRDRVFGVTGRLLRVDALVYALAEVREALEAAERARAENQRQADRVATIAGALTEMPAEGRSVKAARQWLRERGIRVGQQILQAAARMVASGGPIPEPVGRVVMRAFAAPGVRREPSVCRLPCSACGGEFDADRHQKRKAEQGQPVACGPKCIGLVSAAARASRRARANDPAAVVDVAPVAAPAVEPGPADVGNLASVAQPGDRQQDERAPELVAGEGGTVA